MNTEEIRAIVVKDLDLQGLTPKEQDDIIGKFTENTLKRVTLALYEKMPEAARAAFVRLGEAGDSDGLLKLFQANVPDLDSFVRAEIKQEIETFKEFQTAA